MSRTTAYILASFLLVSPAAADDQDPMQEFEDAAKGAAAQIVGALKGLLLAVPQYEAPEILDNGDIIIRRKNRSETDEEASPPRIKETNADTVL